MKQQRLRFKLLALILFGMFLLLAVFHVIGAAPADSEYE